MIIGAHVIITSTDADADRAFLRDVLSFPHIDGGDGWLIFSLPPSEIAVHPADLDDEHELNLMCDDVAQFVSDMKARGIETDPVEDEGWGLVTHVKLPAGGKLAVYQPRHPRPPAMTPARSKPAKARSRKSASRPKQKRTR